LLWYAKDITRATVHKIWMAKEFGGDGADQYTFIEMPDGTRRRMTSQERTGESPLPPDARIFRGDNLTSSHEYSLGRVPVHFEGRTYTPGTRYWSTSPDGISRLAEEKRLIAIGNTLSYVRYLDDFPVFPLTNVWTDTAISGFAEARLYAVQTSPLVIKRCMLMTTNPGDLVLDPTCGSGTTASVAEGWGRRWITIDVSRVPLALARQRLLTNTYPYFQLKDVEHGPAGGFVYTRKQNRNGEEVGGIISHTTMKSIANNEPAEEEILVDRPDAVRNVTRVSGPFTVEATIPTPLESGLPEDEGGEDESGGFAERLLEALRKSPVLRLGGNRTVTVKNVRPQAKTLSLSAEAVDDDGHAVAFVFGPENGAVSERLVFEAAREAYAKSYAHLYVIGLQIEANALLLVNSASESVGIPATYVPVTPDITMGDLLKNMRSSQIFSVCGLPDVALRPAKDGKYEVELRGLDTFDPVTMDNDHMDGDDVPAWFLDTDYNGLCFHVTQAFFPRTSAWDNLKKTLKADYEAGVWDRLAGNLSVPFEMGEHRQVAVKVIDDRGNELIVIRTETEAEK